MPLGNGDIGANAWVAPNGDLIFYISKTDSWGDNGRLHKVGKVRVRFSPPLFSPGTQFSQKLDLDTARLIEIKAIHEKFPQDAFRYLEMTKPDFEGFPESKEINSQLAEWKK